MNVVITGANGFIGRNLLEKFVYEGYNTIGWDINFDESRNIKRVDLLKKLEIENALSADTPDILIHCAGNANVGSSFEDVQRDFDLNVSITHNLLFAMHKLGLSQKRFIFLSSASVYGNPEILPIKEDAKKKPISPYALHKSLCEDICLYFINNYNFDIKIARIFSAYGNGLRKQVFWDMYQKYIKNDEIQMYGSGKESRDFIHIDDLKVALFLMATKEYKDIIINVGNGSEVTILEAANLFAKYIDDNGYSVVFNGRSRQGDPNNWQADISRLKKLGYLQNISIEDGVKRYCNWLRNI